MKHPWSERARLINSPSEIQKYYEAYHIPTAEAAIDFINRWCFTMDPRRTDDRVIPFELFDKQEEYIRWLWDRYTNREDGVVDKCRGVGMSWMNAAFSVFLFLFHESVTISMYTYKADECHEKGNIDTLLEKCIFICAHLPKLFTEGVEDKLMQVKNHRNGSIIVGKSGDSPGRGGRSSIYFLDECAFYPRADSIEAAVSRNADCKIWGSTHHGTSTLFYRKTTSGVNPVFVIDWWEIPMYNQEWYDAERAKAEAEGTLHIFMQEVERNAAASLESVCCPPEWVSSIKRNDNIINGARIAALDPANEGGDTHGFCVIDGNQFIYADESGEGDPGDATDKYFWKAHEMGCKEFRYDPIGVGAAVAGRLKEILIKVDEELLKLHEELKKCDKEISIIGLRNEIARYESIKKMRIIPWNAGGAVVRPSDQDYAETNNKDFFENAKAQAWWSVRHEMLNTYRFLNGKDYEAGELISIYEQPSQKMEKLLLELSQPQYTTSKSGKLMIDKKPKGTKSPNLADAYVICRAEVTPDWISWATV